MRKVLIRAVIAIAITSVYGTMVLAEEVKSGDNFSTVGSTRNFASAPKVHEYLFAARRGPAALDRIALHRVTRSPAGSSEYPVILYLPGTWMNGTVAPDNPRDSLGVSFAARGIDFWALDYRTHFVPVASAQSDLAELKGWTNALFEVDIDAAVRFIMATTGRRRIAVAGFSRGVSLAYLYAADHP